MNTTELDGQTPGPRPPAGRASAEFVPAVPRLWVPRPALMSLLDDIVNRPATLIVAPAGAGKTTSLAAWCRDAARAVSWVRSGSDLTRGALGRLLVEAAGAPCAPRAPSADVLEQLQAAEARRIIVVDDAHLLPSACFRLVDEVLRTAPSAVRLVLLCRWDPPLAKVGPMLHGALRVLRGDALRFTEDEARHLVTLHAPHLSDNVVATILERAQGWAAILALAARTVSASPQPQVMAGRLAEPEMAVADLLANQVFTTLGERTRHVLLCVAEEEPVSAPTAVALSGDQNAGGLLAELAESGLLVTRDDGPAPDVPVFRLHPLLAEVLRRRLHLGGVAVAQARACVRKAALCDLAQGNVPEAFIRLVRAQAWPEVVGIMADRGDELIMTVPSFAFRDVVTAAADLIEASPRAWVAIALDRWVGADPNEAAHWIRRVLAQPPSAPFPQVELSLLQLLAARIGAESPAAAVAHARDVVDNEQLAGAAPALSAWLLLELGVAESWLGELTTSASHLRWASSIAEAVSRQLLAASLSHLAQTEYLLGNHHSADVLAQRMLERIPDTGAMTAVTARANVVRELVSPLANGPGDTAELATAAFAPALDDPMTKVLRTICVGRRRQRPDQAAGESLWLELPQGMPPTPPHVAARLALERCLLAVIRSDVPAIELVHEQLTGLNADAEAALVDGVLADLRGAVEQAVLLVEPAAVGTAPALLAHTSTAAAVCRAALLDTLGRSDEALAVLYETVLATAAQRVIRPFFWPSVHGTPTATLLRHLRDRDPSRWLADLHQAVSAWEQASARHGPTTWRTTSAMAEIIAATLTRRERDVLGELARGSTYADIAETLFVTENTVKTHVSAAYAKLGVTRRSEALKLARSLGLV